MFMANKRPALSIMNDLYSRPFDNGELIFPLAWIAVTNKTLGSLSVSNQIRLLSPCSTPFYVASGPCLFGFFRFLLQGRTSTETVKIGARVDALSHTKTAFAC